MGRPRKEAPPDGGAVQGEGVVREQIKQMTGFATSEEMAEALPDNTMSLGDEDSPAPRRKRRSKAEMAASRGEYDKPEIDPLMQDKRYRESVEEMRTAGLSTTVKGGFETAALVTKDESWQLDDEEFGKVDNFSYVLSKKYPIMDPTNHWLSMALYFFALLGTFCFKRMAKTQGGNMMKWFTDLFQGEEEQLDAQELENEKAASV